MSVEVEYNEEDLEILQVLRNYSREKLQQAKITEGGCLPASGSELTQEGPSLSDTVLVMLAKEIEYVQSLTRHKSGFLFNDRKLNIFTEVVTSDLVPGEFRDLWKAIEQGSSRRCHSLKKFFLKMLSSKNVMFAKECFLIYFQCLQSIIREDSRSTSDSLHEQALKEASRQWARQLYWLIVVETEEGEFMKVNENYTNITLLNRNIHLKQLMQFQQTFRQKYRQFRQQLLHLLEVTYYCIAVQYYGISRNYLYEGYYRNTELQTVRGAPK